MCVALHRSKCSHFDILVSELQCFYRLEACCLAALRSIKIKQKQNTANKIRRLISAALLVISSLCLSCRPLPLDPLTSIEKINAIHYHYRQEEIQGQREWNASHRFFWHIHHICDEQCRRERASLQQLKPGKTLRPERIEVTPTLMF